MDSTATVIATLVSLIAIIAFVGKFIAGQTKVSVQLAQIQKELAELKTMVCKKDDQVRTLETRIFAIETKCKYIQAEKVK